MINIQYTLNILVTLFVESQLIEHWSPLMEADLLGP